MNIRYRSKFTGTFISASDAGLKKFAKAVVSELVDTASKKIMGRAPGYFTQPKKLARVVLDPVASKPPRRYTPPPLEVPEDNTDSDAWGEYADEYQELDALDELDELEEDEEWYEEA